MTDNKRAEYDRQYQAKTTEQMNVIAQELGFDTWSKFETAVKNKEIDITIKVRICKN